MNSKNRIVVYTSIFGNYDGLIPQKRIKGVDFICFTDQSIRADPWKIIHCKPIFDDATRNARYYKILPHLHLPNYEVSIWIDGNFLIEKFPEELTEKLSNHPLIAFAHGRNCIYREYEGIIDLGKQTGKFKDNPELMKAQVDRYKEEGFPENFGLCQTGVMVRQHNHPDVIKTMEVWWSEIEKGSKRDQLSLFYTIWKTGLSVSILPQDARNNQWFYMLGKHRRNYRWKLLRYQIKKLFGLKRKYQI